jgi:hypothetical protein
MKNFKIVLTGGPCGGKTTSIGYLQQKLGNKYNVLVLDEIPNGLLQLGYLDEVKISLLDFQRLLFNIQFINEYNAEKECDILLCDRGLLDSKAYLNSQQYNEILKINNLSCKDILNTYNLALYYRTIAYEYPDLFRKQRIYETPESAIFKDKQSLVIWKEILLNAKYLNTEGFQTKINKIYDSMYRKILSDNFDEGNVLSDYYDENTIKSMKNGIDEILYLNNISPDVTIKTRGLVK